MAGYQDPDIVSDESALAEQWLEVAADQVDGWEPHDGQLEPVIAEATAVVVAPVNTLLKDELRADLEGFGTTVLGLDPEPAAAATSTVAVTFSDPGTLPAGAQLVVTLADGEDGVMVTLADAVGAATGSVVTGVPATAQEPGAAGNGATGVARLWDAYAFVQSIDLEAPTSGGADEEDRDHYRDRVVRRARRFLGIPATVADMAAAALDVPGVARAVAINLLDPAHPEQQGTAAAEGHVTVVGLDAAGADLAAPVNAAIIAETTPEDQRLLQVTIHTDAPDRTDVTVAFTATATSAAAIDAAEAAVADYLSGAGWGYDDTKAGLWDPSADTVYFLEVAQVIQQVEGINLLESLTINGGDANVPLPGFAPLPNLVSVTGTLAS